MSLPGNFSFSQVTGSFVAVVADSTTDGDSLPDTIPIEGYVIFKAAPVVLIDAGDVLFALPKPVKVKLVAGILTDNDGNSSVTLVATDAIDISPTDWTWTVSFELVGFQMKSFNFLLPGGGTFDLSELVPTDYSPGSGIGGGGGGSGATGPTGPTGATGTGSSNTTPILGQLIAHIFEPAPSTANWDLVANDYNGSMPMQFTRGFAVAGQKILSDLSYQSQDGTRLANIQIAIWNDALTEDHFWYGISVPVGIITFATGLTEINSWTGPGGPIGTDISVDSDGDLISTTGGWYNIAMSCIGA